MILDAIQNGFTVDSLIAILLSVPALLLALSAHEAAHGYVAMRCGDPTARMLGRVTLNPIKHVDVVGFAMLFLVGFGWAKPVPVNPRNFKHYRRDDLLVSLAGITANLIMFMAGCVVMYAWLYWAMGQVPGLLRQLGEGFAVEVGQEQYWVPVDVVLALPTAMDTFLITPFLGKWAGYFYQMLIYFVIVNLSLAVFNLLPVPPLDGYHVLNDLILKRNLFAGEKVARVGQAVLFALVLTGFLSKGISWVLNFILDAVGSGALGLFSGLGLV